MILETIVAHKRKELERDQERLPLGSLQNTIATFPPTRDFRAAISIANCVNLIAEVKKKSPSKGLIREASDSVSIAQIYERHGASAVSVLTDYPFFGGELKELTSIRKVINQPILRKDFTIDPYHIYQARAAGADAILLIVAILTVAQLRDFMHLGQNLGLACLVEVHTQAELELALQADADIIGINNRNLKTFETDIDTTFRLRPSIPRGKIVVSESGINTNKQVQELKEAEVNAMLVGESLMRSQDIGCKIRELMGVPGSDNA